MEAGKTSKKQDLQDKLLQKLSEYGDSVLDVKNERKKKRSISNNTELVLTENGTTSNFNSDNVGISDNTVRKRKGKKKKKKRTEDSLVESADCVQNDKTLTGKDKQLDLLKTQLGLTEFKSEQEKKKKQEKKTAEEKRKNEPEVVVFTSHRSKSKSKVPSIKSAHLPITLEENPEFDMKSARFEVQKFGIKGFQGDKKEEAMTSLLVKLGAKVLSFKTCVVPGKNRITVDVCREPPKNKYVNYKEFQENRKQQMEVEKDQRDMERKLGYKVAKKTTKRTRDRNDIGHIDGQMGKFRSGVQFVKMDDVKKFKKSKIK